MYCITYIHTYIYIYMIIYIYIYIYKYACTTYLVIHVTYDEIHFEVFPHGMSLPGISIRSPFSCRDGGRFPSMSFHDFGSIAVWLEPEMRGNRRWPMGQHVEKGCFIGCCTMLYTWVFSLWHLWVTISGDPWGSCETMPLCQVDLSLLTGGVGRCGCVGDPLYLWIWQ